MPLSVQKADKIYHFDPDGAGKLNGNLFGLPFTAEECGVIVIPVPWEATVSNRIGTALAPEAILKASIYIELYDKDVPDAWKLGVGMPMIPIEWIERNTLTRKRSRACIEYLEQGGGAEDDAITKFIQSINSECAALTEWVKSTSEFWLSQNKLVAVLGGEGSSSYGLIESLSNRYEAFSILQFDAHADLRVDYQGFKFSHASCMYRALELSQVEKLVQVGVRDYCKTEVDFIEKSAGRVIMFEDETLKNRQLEGESWKKICDEIIDALSQYVYINFDITGLEPSLCPNSGTPVPGGLRYEEAVYLIHKIARSGRKIIGFDLCEVSPGAENDWDALVGARLLYFLSNMMAFSQGRFNNS